MKKVTVVVPAHNEENYVERCLRSIKRAARYYGGRVEVIVVCNRCTDRTKEIAERCGARTVLNEDRCIARVRNAGIAAASGDIVMTVDCDNRMTKGTIAEAVSLLESGIYIGGGAPMLFERYSLPLFLNDMIVDASFKLTGLYCGIFWAEKKTWEAVGGFEDIRAMEDGVTAKKLKAYGKKHGKYYGCLRKNYFINSTRKYDDLGDWLYLKLMVKSAGTFVKAAFGKNDDLNRLLDDLFYDYNDKH